MLEFQHVPINMSGLDNKSDDKNSIPGTFITADNVYMLKNGKIQNRAGYAFPSSPVTHTSEVIATAAYGDSSLAIERRGQYYFDESSGNTVTSTGQNIATIDYETAVTPMAVSSPYGNSQLPILGYTQSVGANFGVAAWVVNTSGTTYEINYVKFRLDSKTIILQRTSTFTSAVYLNPMALGESYLVKLSSVSQIQILNIQGLTTTTSIAAAGGTLTRFDANESTNYVAVVQTSNAVTTTKLSLYNKLSAAVSNATLSLAKTYDTLSVSINDAETEIYVAAGLSNGAPNDIDVYVFNIALTLLQSYSLAYSALNIAQIQLIEDKADTTKLIGLFTNEGLPGTPFVEGLRIVKTTGALSSTFGAFYQYVQVSRVKYPYVIFRNHADVLNTAYFAIDLSGTFFRILSSFYYGQAIPYKTLYGSHELIEFTATHFPFVTISPLSSLSAVSKIYSLFFSYMGTNTTSNLPYLVNFNGSLITNAWGNPRILDNATSEFPLFSSWPISSPALSIANSGTVGNLVAGDYGYLAVYTAYDNNGNAIYSSPIYATIHTVPGGTTSVDVTYTEVSGFVRPRGNIALYRTEMNGSVLYFVKNISSNPTNDGLSDANLLLNRALYTTGDIVDSAPVPTAKFMGIAKSRLWVISAENDSQVFFSKRIFPGEAPQFNSIYTILVQSAGGELQAIAEMDDKILIFRKNAVYVTYGEGPDELGNGSFADPQLITQSLGCKYPRSIVLNDKGIFFMSYEGIYMISRGLTVEYVGAAVENYNDLTITQALNLVDRHQTWFYSAEGSTLVFDDFFGRWYTFSNEPTYAAFILNDDRPAYYRALSAAKYPGRLLIEDDTKYYDGANDNPIGVTLESGWLTLSGVQGFQRMKTFTLLGELNDTLTLELSHDFETSVDETFNVSPSTVGTSPAQYQVMPKRQKCESVKYKMTIAELTGNFSLSSMGIEAGIKQGTVKFARSKRIAGV